jgi:hypothetical protein
MRRTIAALIIYLLVLVPHAFCQTTANTTEKAIKKEIVDSLTGIKKDLQITRPLKDKGPTKVALEMFILDIDNVDTASQNFDINIYYRLTWNDPRLANQYTEKVRKPLSGVWHPRFQFVNQQRLWSTFDEMVDIYPDGKVVYQQRNWGSFSQPLELKDFPFDTQTFNIIVVPAIYDKDEVVFYSPKDSESGIAPRFSVADWNIIDWKMGPIPSPRKSSKRAVYGMSITASRESGYFVIQMIVPLIFIVLMSWAVFWIDPQQSGTQITVATTAMLTLIAFRFTAGVTLPRFDYLTRLDYFILASTVLVFGSLLEVVISSALARSNKLAAARGLDRISRIIFPVVFLYFIVDILFLHF